MPSDLPLVVRPAADELRAQLYQLTEVGKALQAERATLEHQLRSVQERIAANEGRVRAIMADLDARMFKEHRSQSQPQFQRSVVEDETVIEGIRAQMAQSLGLTSAVEAVSKNQGTIADNNLLLTAIMTQLSGDPFQLAHRVARRITEIDRIRAQQRENFPLQLNLTYPSPGQHNLTYPLPALPALPGIVNPPLPLTQAAVVGDVSIRTTREPSVIPLLSPSIKSESDSTANPHNDTNTQPDLTEATMHDDPATVARSVESTPVPRAEQSQVVAHGMAALQKDFPGLLESLSIPSMTRTKLTPTSPASAAVTPTGARSKRGRASMEADDSPSQGAAKTGKKVKTDKEPTIAHTFVRYLTRLEQTHQYGGAITEMLKCARCQVIKRDVRVLNCLHLYCHRCILKLRTEASKGDAVKGFQSFCVKPACTQVVSGKTTVIDSDIIDFLQWYDKQSPTITSLPAQVNVLNAALVKYPEDEDIKRKLDQVQAQYGTLLASGEADIPCDLMQIAKLARKPY
ncbi:uncharacterized protein A1O5_07988 [Cladophialophora psammophila CBS 110553]|uniref:RING-type domain-containing protein n=1 Tax=Cladophialophora psammophila CBS 110553 TaxID=1182543 RepID=W9WME3_9EURO|nr:uncharacterized protein A1O5_07988 [Cladophialophora psammophila CBS 110553]EXJ69053.1 hypothetical protein A1O5_07988 [Cladophialophora psammophila CBS 110553]